MTLTRSAWAGLGMITALIFLLLYGPLLMPIVSSLFTLDHGSILWGQPSLESYAALARNETILEAVTNTLAVGAAAVVLSIVIGMVMALHYCSGRSVGREIMQFVVFLPFLMPPMVTGLSLLVFFREIDFDRSLITITIGHTVFTLTLAYRTIAVRLQSLEPSIIEASYDLGASNWQTFRYILLPSLRGALIGAAVLCFALSFDETMITILVTGPDSTLPVLLWAMTRLGFPPDVNALVTLVLALTTLMCLIAAWQLLPQEMNVEEAN